MAAMSSKVLAEIQARAAMGRLMMADIEVSLNRSRGMYNNWHAGIQGPHCVLARKIPNQKIKICSDCPLWLTTDAIYEEVYEAHVIQSYDWWRSEFVRTGQTYAKDRMVDFVKTWEPELYTPSETLISGHWYDHKTPLQVLMFGIALGLVIGIAIQTLVNTWPFLFQPS